MTEPKSDALATALEALKAVEWRGGSWGVTPTCAWCGGWQTHPQMDEDYHGVAGHKSDCQRQVAIAALAALRASRGPQEATAQDVTASHGSIYPPKDKP